MSFVWKEYYAIAKGWEQTGNTEAIYRSIISRSYYAAFCISRNYLKISHRTARVHEEVREKFKDSDDPDIIVAGNTLESLRIARNIADYDAKTLVNKSLAVNALEKAKIVLDIIEELES